MIRYSAIALVLLAAGSAQAAEKTLDRTFTVSPGGGLVVDADGATVQVSGKDTNQVTVHIIARGSEAQSGDGVTVTVRRQKERSWFSWNWNADETIEVTVPKNFRIGVRTGGGNIAVADTTGTVKLNTSGGDITVKNVNGSVDVHTSGGGILADTIRGDVDADTSGGDVRLLKVDGKIRAHTSGGNVRCSLVGVNRGITASTSGGDIELTLPPGTTGNVQATTSGGEITTDLPVATTSVKEGRLAGSLNGGGESIDAHTSGGSIRLRAG